MPKNKTQKFVITQSEINTKGNKRIYRKEIELLGSAEIDRTARSWDPAFHKLNAKNLLIGDRLTYSDGKYIWTIQRLK